eukprot:6841985-Pyramimonas_sp.AAC.1
MKSRPKSSPRRRTRPAHMDGPKKQPTPSPTGKRRPAARRPRQTKGLWQTKQRSAIRRCQIRQVGRRHEAGRHW